MKKTLLIALSSLAVITGCNSDSNAQKEVAGIDSFLGNWIIDLNDPFFSTPNGKRSAEELRANPKSDQFIVTEDGFYRVGKEGERHRVHEGEWAYKPATEAIPEHIELWHQTRFDRKVREIVLRKENEKICLYFGEERDKRLFCANRLVQQ